MISLNLSGPFVLGAAQLGMHYGVANRAGELNQGHVDDILSAAWEQGVRIVDTAPSYGESEKRIGSYLARHPSNSFQIVTKLSAAVDTAKLQNLVDSIESSIDRLGVTPAALLLHNPNQLSQWNGGLGEALSHMKESGRFGNIGVSTYTPAEFQSALENVDIDCIQAPFSFFDQRLIQSGLIAKAVQKKKRLFFRSVFLQGLLVMPPDRVAARFGETSQFYSWSERWWRLSEQIGREVSETALGYVVAMVPGAGAVLGCESTNQVEANAGILNRLLLNPLSAADLQLLAQMPQPPVEIIDPRLWPAQ